MVTPYITPAVLVSAPTGASWDIIPSPGAAVQDTDAELTNVCWRATSYIDSHANQVLRATADTEYLDGPGQPRCSIDPHTGNGVLQMRRWPVTQVLAVQTSPARAFPRVWTPAEPGRWDIRHPLIYSGDSASATAPDGGWTIDLAPDILTRGRGGQRVQVSYVNGWPHTSLTAPAPAGATTLTVDDVTGWAGASGFVYDGANTETLSVTDVEAAVPLVLPNGAGVAQAGPGTVTLASGLAFAHDTEAVVSALPANVMLAAVWAAAGQALQAGVDAIAIQSIAGQHIESGGSGLDMLAEACKLVDRYLRIA